MSKRNFMLALNQTPDGKCPKNPFDLTSIQFSTSKMGQFLPVGCIETVPDGHYDVGVDNYTFTLPCNTASLGNMKENFYFLWIPYSQLFNSAYPFFVQRRDNQSSLYQEVNKVPYFKLGDVVYHCVAGALGQLPGIVFDTDIHGFNIYEGALRLLDLLGYGCYLDFLYALRPNYDGDDSTTSQYPELTLSKFKDYCDNVLNNEWPNILRIAAYQKAWYCYFRNTIYDTSIPASAFNFDDVVLHRSGVNADYNVMSHRDIDDFVRECLQIRYVGYKKDIFTGCMPGTQFGAVSAVGITSSTTISTTGTMSGVTGKDSDRWTKYGGSFHEEGEGSLNDTGVFGINFVEDPITHEARSVQLGMHGDRYDSVNEEYVNGWDPIAHDHTFTGSISSSGSLAAGTSLFDVLQLVEAQAVQKWKQKSMLAGQRGVDQYRAHYGIVPRHMQDHYPDFLGSVDNPIVIDKVVSNANTAFDVEDSTNLGDLGGRGYGASDKRTFHVHSSEHGVIMVFRAIIPENVYGSYGLDRANQLINYTDFWQPEYQDIGLEAVSKYNFDVSNHPTGSVPVHPNSENWNNLASTIVHGYAPRNYQLKGYLSKVHGRLNPTRLLQYVATGGPVPFGFSDLQAFVLPRLDAQCLINIAQGTGVISAYTMSLAMKTFYVSPSMANSCFFVDADSSEETDEFIHKCRLICSSIQPLTTLGIPQF